MAASTTGRDLDDPVTRHMRLDYLHLNSNQTVEQAFESILQRQPEGRVIYFYVVDDDRKLVGVVPARRLLLSQRHVPIADIMVTPVVAIPLSATLLEACEFFMMHKMLAFPVVDGDRRLLGVVDVDLFTSEMTEIDRREDQGDLFQLIGVHLTEAQQRSSLSAFSRRFPWLLVNIAGGLLAAVIADAYQDVSTLALVVPFIPIVLALSESVSIQSVSLAVQTLHGRRPTWRQLRMRAWRELQTGVLLGLTCGLTVALTAMAWKGRAPAALALLGGICGGVSAAAVVGVSLPYIFRILKRDPQVAAGPIALALADTTVLIVYFSLVRLLMAPG